MVQDVSCLALFREFRFFMRNRLVIFATEMLSKLVVMLRLLHKNLILRVYRRNIDDHPKHNQEVGNRGNDERPRDQCSSPWGILQDQVPEEQVSCDKQEDNKSQVNVKVSFILIEVVVPTDLPKSEAFNQKIYKKKATCGDDPTFEGEAVAELLFFLVFALLRPFGMVASLFLEREF